MGAHHMNFSMGSEKCTPTYTYQDGPFGPNQWSGVCQTGNMQSPVNIRDAEQLPLGGLLKFGYAPVDLDENQRLQRLSHFGPFS
jgi:carbonic anhydrase